jgi:sporulation protein YlmC with PRC-barrel domain
MGGTPDVGVERLLRPWLSTASNDSEVGLVAVDTETLLSDAEGFLVDGPDGEPIGVVDEIELDEARATVSGLVVAAGWFGRRHFRVAVDAIEAVFPDERRIIVREASPVPPHGAEGT